MNVSVVIPTYQRAHLIGRTIDSVLNQLKPGDELIIVDDGSTDETLKLLKRYGSRLTVISQANQGAGTARNTGLSAARHNLVAFIDSDDEWLPLKLDLQRAFLEHRDDVLFCFTDFMATSPDGQLQRHYLTKWRVGEPDWSEVLAENFDSAEFSSSAGLDVPQFQCHIGDLRLAEFRSSNILTSTLLVNRARTVEELRFAEDVGTWEDWEFFSRLSLAGKAGYLDVETAIQHFHAGERLSYRNSLPRFEAQRKIVDRVWGASSTFRAEYGKEFEEMDRTINIELAKTYLIYGYIEQARQAFSRVRSPQLYLRTLFTLPDILLSWLFRLRKTLKHH